MASKQRKISWFMYNVRVIYSDCVHRYKYIVTFVRQSLLQMMVTCLLYREICPDIIMDHPCKIEGHAGTCTMYMCVVTCNESNGGYKNEPT